MTKLGLLITLVTLSNKRPWVRVISCNKRPLLMKGGRYIYIKHKHLIILASVKHWKLILSPTSHDHNDLMTVKFILLNKRPGR